MQRPEQSFAVSNLSSEVTFPPLVPQMAGGTVIDPIHELHSAGRNLSSDEDPDILPPYLTEMSSTSRNCVLAYFVLFLIAASGNLSVFWSILRRLQKSKSRICVLILHLSIADLMVTFFVMPIEIFWRLSVGWYGGNVLCKICQFLRAFGLYLSSMVLICISVDRYFAIMHPLKNSSAKRRGRTMLASAWIASVLSSLPQSVIFRVKSHPTYLSFLQCVSLDFFSSVEEEVAYNVSSLCLMYFIPLLVVIFTYGRILWKIHSKSRQQRLSRKNLGEATGKILLRRSNYNAPRSLERAKARTLRITLIIILVFVLCWTPYAVITLWYMFDRENASKLDPDVQEGLFIMAVANSCVNPLVYGSYAKECRDTVVHCCLSEGRSHRIISRNNSKYTASYRCPSTTIITAASKSSIRTSRPVNTTQMSLNSAILLGSVGSGLNQRRNFIPCTAAFQSGKAFQSSRSHGSAVAQCPACKNYCESSRLAATEV